MKRIFIAIPIPAELTQHIHEFRNSHQNLQVRWLADKNLHITLAPPVEVTEEQLTAMISGLKDIESPGPFPIHFTTVSAGNTPHMPHLIWARGDAPTELLQLKQKIIDALSYRPARPNSIMHITLARFKKAELEKQPALKELHETVHWKMLADSFAIMESRLLPAGAEYIIVDTFPL